jgi:hypothetical protein
MLRSIEALEKYAIHASDGKIGHATDFYFDDDAWTVRYLVVDTGTWLSERKVLISPISIGHLDERSKIVQVLLTKEQVKNSPDFDTQKPVSRQHEMGYLGYYGYPYYWDGAGLWGPGSFPSLMLSGMDTNSEADYDKQQIELSQQRLDSQTTGSQSALPGSTKPAPVKRDDPHLRSCKAVVGYEIQATDGHMGRVAGFLVDEQTWAIRYLIVETSHWWSGHKVLIVPEWISDVNWFESTLSVALSRADVKESPPFDSCVELDREQEVGLYKHYDRSGYWTNQL